MEKSWKIAKIQNFMETCLPGKKVMEKSWKSVVQIHHGKSWNFVFEFVWEQSKNIFEMIQFQSKNLIKHTDLYFCTISWKLVCQEKSHGKVVEISCPNPSWKVMEFCF